MFSQSHIVCTLALGLMAASYLLASPAAPPVADPTLWLDAADPTSLVLDESGKVADWKDVRKNGSSVKQVEADRRPGHSSSAFEDRPAVVFSGSNWLSVPPDIGGIQSSQGTVFVIFRTAEEHPVRLMAFMGSGQANGTTAGFALAFNDTDIVTGNNAAALVLYDGKTSLARTISTSDARKQGVDRTLAPQFPLLLSASFQSGQASPAIQVQGRDLKADIPSPGAPGSANIFSLLTVGAADSSGQFPFAGALAEVLVYDCALSPQECRKIDEWLIERHSLRPPGDIIYGPGVQPISQMERPQTISPDGTFLRLSNGSLFEKRGESAWTKRFDVVRDKNFPNIPLTGGLLATTPQGTLILITADRRPQGFVKLQRKEGTFNSKEARTDIYAFRSVDGGKTWQDGQKLQSDYCGAMRDIKVTKSGDIVASLQAWDPRNERHITVIQTSKDDGKTFHAVRLDSGVGRGLHDGFFESTLTELGDGRLWLLGRTGLGVFWQSTSSDGGLSWSKPEPTKIDSSSYPGYLLRLKSGRILLAWNRYYPDGFSGRDDLINIAGAGWFWGLQPVSRFNRELSVIASDDDGATWSPPVVIAEGRHDFSAISYPLLIEDNSGKIFVWAGSMSAKFDAENLSTR